MPFPKNIQSAATIFFASAGMHEAHKAIKFLFDGKQADCIPSSAARSDAEQISGSLIRKNRTALSLSLQKNEIIIDSANNAIYNTVHTEYKQ